MTSLAQPLEPGAVVAGDFRVERPLARGGMGTLYVVTQLSTGHERVLKVMHARLQRDPRGRDRFLQEARASARIESDHVVQVMSAGFDDAGVPWLVMELLKGEDLAAALERRGRFSVDEALTIFRQLGHALGAAHAAGMIHRDLKPENIFLANSRREGSSFTVKLLDFGIAKVLDESGAEGRNTSAVGTPLWMSPEQAEKGSISPASDVWSMGLVAFNVLTGKRYWKVGNDQGVPMERMLRELFVDPIEPASIRAARYGASLPAGFDAWFARCVVRTARERFSNATEATSALVPVLMNAPSPAAVSNTPVAPVPGTQPGVGVTPVGASAYNPWNAPSQYSSPAASIPSQYGAPSASIPSQYGAPSASIPSQYGAPSTGSPSIPPAAPNVPSGTMAWQPGQPSPTGPRPAVLPSQAIGSGGSNQGAPPIAWLDGSGAPAAMNGRVSVPGQPFEGVVATPPKSNGALWAVVGILVLGGLGAGTFAVIRMLDEDTPSQRDAGAPVTVLTHDSGTPRTTPPPPPGPPPTAQPGTVGTGFAHGCAITRTRGVACWGWNAFGQLGDGTTTDRPSPTVVQGLTGVVEIAVGYAHGCARLADGTVRCWGLNSNGQLGDGTATTRTTPVAVRGLTAVAQLGVGDGHSCARRTDGSVYCWGCNGSGQIGDGTAVDRATPAGALGLSGVTDVSAGNEHTCARRGDGTVQCWGAGSFGQVGDGWLQSHFRPSPVSGMTRAAVLALGPYRSCALLTDGSMECWGRNESGQLGDRTRVSRSTPVPIPGLGRGNTAMAVGAFHACAAGGDRVLRCWGSNANGRLGDGSNIERGVAVPALGLTGFAEVRAGEAHSCARDAQWRTACWGANWVGQMGDGTTLERRAPVGVGVP